MIHRDIKPDNIMIGLNGIAKIGDFGIMKSLENTLAKTKTGTDHYMAPEVAMGSEYSTSVDIWSLCATFYHILKGYPPYYIDNYLNGIQYLISKANPDNYVPLNPDNCACEVLREIINDIMIQKPSQRITAAEILSRISKIGKYEYEGVKVTIEKTENDAIHYSGQQGIRGGNMHHPTLLNNPNNNNVML